MIYDDARARCAGHAFMFGGYITLMLFFAAVTNVFFFTFLLSLCCCFEVMSEACVKMPLRLNNNNINK